ncbi:MAG: DUF1640 domain-containing protein [Candidatus Methanofishera endochildressiae]|jgi:hypothetical protein|uniref:DUF1640 domain-containing protein n=1 Tax=Candidatus Methanofishera endochildressiae TaxID=2738884 RepID=A0A7Z0MNQ3_9GAMM|nr:DUF1640 domain-containing protein [Candidatus Methanofishera endochildressiae]
MTTLVFDTHVYVKRLHAVGFSEEQAEVVVALQQEAVNATLGQMRNSELATKHDLTETELKIELKIAETNTAIAQIKAGLIRWIMGVGFLQTALITALLLKVSSGL